MKDVSLYIKILDYLCLVLLNRFFVIGIVIGYVVKALYGGVIISLLTGLTVGVLLHEIFKLIFWG
jgi:hypothetical protein